LRKAIPRLLVIAGAAVLIAATAWAVSVLDRYVTARMAELKDQTVAMAEAFLGRRISYESISPSILNDVEIQNLAILSQGAYSQPLLTLRKVRFSYSLLRLLTDRDMLGALREIRIENTRLAYDASRDRDLAELVTRLASGAAPGAARPFHARIVGANVSLVLSAGASKATLKDIFFTLDPRPDSLDITLRGSVDGAIGGDFTFRSALRVQGKVGRGLDWSDLTMNLLSFSSSVLNTGAQSLQLVWKGKSLEVRKIQDRSPVDLQLLADLENRYLTLHFMSDHFRPDRLFQLTGGYRGLNKWLTTPLTAAGSVTYGIDHGTLSYQARLNAVFPDQLPLPEIAVDALFSGTERQADFQSLRLASASGALEFTGDVPFSTFYPQGTLTLDGVQALGEGKVSARLAVTRTDGGLHVTGENLEVGDLGLKGLDLTLSPVAGGSRFRLTTAFAEGAHEHSLSAEGSLVLGSPPSLALSASLTNVPPDRLYLLLSGGAGDARERKSMQEFLSQFGVSANLTVKTDFTHLAVTSTPVVVSQWDDPRTRLQCAVSLEGERLRITDFTGTWRGLAVTGDFSGSMYPDRRLSFSSRFALQGTPYAVSGSYSPDMGLVVSGSYGLDVGVSFAGDGGVSFQARAQRLPLPFGVSLEPVSFDVDGSFPASGPWGVRITSLTVSNLPVPQSPVNSTEVSGELTPEGLELSRVRFTDALSILEGSGSGTYRLGPEVFDEGLLKALQAKLSLDLRARGTTETYRVSGSLSGGEIGVDAEFSGTPLRRLGQYAATGELAGSIHIAGPPDQLTLEGTASLQNGRLGTDPITIGLRFALAGQRFDLRSLTVRYLAHSLTEGTGTIQLDTGSYSFSGRYHGELLGDSVDTAAKLEGTMSRKGDASLFDSRLNAVLTLATIKVNAKPMDPWGMSLRTEGGVLFFDGGPRQSIHGSIDAQSRFALALQSPLPVICKAQGRVVGDRLDATVAVESADLRILNPILKSPVIGVTSGIASGTLSITGPLNDPDYLGDLEVFGGGITCSYSPDEAGPIGTHFTFNRKNFSFTPVTARVGNGRISATGTFTVDHWSPISFTIDLKTGGPGVRLAGKFGSMRMESRASGQLRITGDDKKTEVRGALTASDCRIAIGERVTGAFVPEDPPTYLSLAVETGKNVEFYWPSVEFPIVRAASKTGGKVAITYRGDTGAYTVKGAADVQGGEVFYFDRSFLLRSGRIVLDENQVDFDPRITMRAEIREWDPKTNEEVKIYLDADNKLSRFSPRFTSDPVRPDVDILAMIGAPIVNRAENQGVGMSAVLLSSDILSQFGLLRPFEQKVREILGLDMFSFRTQLIQNLLAQKLFGTVVNPLDNTTLSLGKYLGNDLFLEMLLRLQSQPGNPGTANIATGVQPDVEVNIEWTTPFFLLDWSFLPRTPETLFLTDNSISLNWRITY
jgi:translocation and assembly module TamB